MHLAGHLWMKNKGSRMADLSRGLVEEDLTSSESPPHVYMSASLKPSMVNAIHTSRCIKQISCVYEPLISFCWVSFVQGVGANRDHWTSSLKMSNKTSTASKHL